MQEQAVLSYVKKIRQKKIGYTLSRNRMYPLLLANTAYK